MAKICTHRKVERGHISEAHCHGAIDETRILLLDNERYEV